MCLNNNVIFLRSRSSNYRLTRWVVVILLGTRGLVTLSEFALGSHLSSELFSQELIFYEELSPHFSLTTPLRERRAGLLPPPPFVPGELPCAIVLIKVTLHIIHQAQYHVNEQNFKILNIS